MTRLSEVDDRTQAWSTAKAEHDIRGNGAMRQAERGFNRIWLRVRSLVNAAVEHRMALELDAFARRYGPL